MAKIDYVEVTLETNMRAVRIALAVLKPLVFLRLISVERAAYLASRLVRVRAR